MRRRKGDGFEWAGPGSPRCGATAEDRETGFLVSCQLRPGHNTIEHHWQRVEGNEVLSASWIGPVDPKGPPTLIGGGDA